MKKKLIIVFLIFISIGVGLFYLLTMGNIGVQYDTAEVIKGEVGLFVEETGTISSRNIRRYYGNGMSEVAEMSLGLGDTVKKGQVLIRYEDKSDLNASIIDLEIKRVEKQIEALEAAYEDAQSGTDMESVNSARIEIARIQNQIDSAVVDRERMQALFEEGIVTVIEVEAIDQRISQLNSSLGIARNNYNQLTKGISDNVRERYEADIDALLISIQILEKNKEQAIDENVIYADVDGVVTELNTFVGDKPSVGIMIMEIQDPTEKVVLVDFMVEEALKIQPDMSAEVQDSSMGLSMTGLTVDKLYPKAFITLSELAVEENRQTVEVGLGEEALALPFGLEVMTRVMVEAPRETLLVPIGAVVDQHSKQYVEVLVDGEPVEREVTTGVRVKGNIEVLQGLAEGEQVILNYQED